ncbi:MAG: mechanosensitive ion channel family protein [Bacteroidetes bacterium]|nr:MAG: mechanosensitive ion channel family protein [Bacteroidota bacterium]
MRTFFQDVLNQFALYFHGVGELAPKFFMAAIVLVVAWFIARLIRNMADKKLKKSMEDPLLAEFLATMTRTVIFIIGISLAFKVLGLSGVTASILAGAGITAFIIGFALRDIGENFLAGILMAFKRPFRVGDFVETGPIRGRVVALNIRDTQLKTPDGKDVYVPNANIIKNPLINYTIDGFLRFDFLVSLPSNTDHHLVMKEIEIAVESVEGVIKRRRKSEVYVTAIAPGRVDVTVSFWIDTFRTRFTSDHIRSEVILRVQKLIERIS